MSLGDSFSDFVSFDSRRSRITRAQNTKSFHDYSGALILLLLIGAFLILLGSLVRLQVFQGAYYKEISQNNRTREIVLHAPRGSIYDRNQTLLAGSEGAFRLKSCNQEGVCESKILSRQDGLKIESAGLPPNSVLEVDSQRFYPKGIAFGSVLGYVSEINEQELKRKINYSLGDRVGRGGLEQQYESNLKGKDGKELIEVDAMGRKIRTLGVVDTVSGNNLNLTIDSKLQTVSYDALDGKKGAVIVSVPQTGEILALVSSPSFDPNDFTILTTDEESRDKKIVKILENTDQPLFDRAVAATYPPGSTFKIISATAGLETGKITVSTTIDDPGILVIGEYKFPNWKYLRDGGTQGILNVVGAMQKSNDIFFYRVGEWTGEEALFAWSKKFGLSSKLGIDLPGEAQGIVPDAAWRKANARDWYLGDVYHAAIGQGDILVTPLQVNSWTNVIANQSKLCKPFLNNNLRNQNNCKDLGIKKENLDLVKRGMEAACADGGTAYPLFNFSVPSSNSTEDGKQKITIACKTGTAEFGDPQNRTHGWLTAYAPADNPQISVTVILEAAGEGSDVAAPVVKKILEEWFTR